MGINGVQFVYTEAHNYSLLMHLFCYKLSALNEARQNLGGLCEVFLLLSQLVH